MKSTYNILPNKAYRESTKTSTNYKQTTFMLKSGSEATRWTKRTDLPIFL